MKKKFERVFTLLLAALLVVSMAGCGGTPSEPPGEEGNDGGGETVVIRVNSAFNSATVDETANGIAALEFVDRVAERTNGAYEIKLFMDSQLGGSTDQIVGGLQTGAFEMCTKAVGDFGEFTDAFTSPICTALRKLSTLLLTALWGTVSGRIASMTSAFVFWRLPSWATAMSPTPSIPSRPPTI